MITTNNRLSAVCVICLVFILWAARYISLPDTSTESLEAAGQRGDAFGALNTLFSGLAVFGLVVTLIIQRRDISDQLRMMHEQMHTDALMEYYRRGDDERVKSARVLVKKSAKEIREIYRPRALMPGGRHVDISATELDKACSIATDFWQFAAMLEEQGRLPIHLFDSISGDRLVESFHTLSPYIHSKRREEAEPGAASYTPSLDYALQFERLADKVASRRTSTYDQRRKEEQERFERWRNQ